MQDHITREITIDAPLQRVWDLVTEPGWWVPTEMGAASDRSPGSVTVRESAEHGRYPVRVESLTPLSHAAFRWAPTASGADITERNSTLVEFHLEPTASGVLVRVVESGFAELDAPQEVREQGITSNSSGWDAELEHLATMCAETATA